MKAFLPLSTLPAGEDGAGVEAPFCACTRIARADINTMSRAIMGLLLRAQSFRNSFMTTSLDGLCNRIEKGRFTALHYRERTANGGAQLLRIGNWTLRIPSQTLRDLCEIDGWIVDGRADAATPDITMVRSRDAFH